MNSCQARQFEVPLLQGYSQAARFSPSAVVPSRKVQIRPVNCRRDHLNRSFRNRYTVGCILFDIKSSIVACRVIKIKLTLLDVVELLISVGPLHCADSTYNTKDAQEEVDEVKEEGEGTNDVLVG